MWMKWICWPKSFSDDGNSVRFSSEVMAEGKGEELATGIRGSDLGTELGIKLVISKAYSIAPNAIVNIMIFG